MIKATFLNIPNNTLSLFNISQRVLYENIKRNKNIEVVYDPTNMEIFNEMLIKDFDHFKQQSNKSNSKVIDFIKSSASTRLFFTTRIFPVAEKYYEFLFSTIKTEYVFISMPSVLTIPFVNFLLKKGLKILLGGNVIRGYGIKKIRFLLDEVNLLTEKESKNLIIFKGYLNVDEDLYKIIQKGEDFESTNPGDSVFTWKKYSDFHSDYMIKNNISMEGRFSSVSLIFQSGCLHSKCLHCTWKNIPVNNFTDDMTVDEMCENVKELCTYRKTKEITLFDGDVIFHKKIRNFCRRMKRAGYYIAITTSVQNFLNATNIKFFNDCCSYINIGIDSCDPYCLKTLNKKHTWDEVLQAVQMIKKHSSPDIEITTFTVGDAPFKNKNDIIRSYHRINSIKHDLLKNINYVSNSVFFLMDFPFLPLMKLKNYKTVESNELLEYQVGFINVLNKVRQYSDFNFDGLQKIMKPIIRYDENNKMLKSDFEYLDNDLIHSI